MAHSKSYRTFIILQEDEKGHSIASDKPLTGYAKIETKNDKCKISFYAQNLKKEYKDCYMMLICNKKDFKKNINLGPVNINQQGKAEKSLEYDYINIGDVNISYEDIVGVALGKNINGKMIFFMCGFLNNQMPKDNWKGYEIKSVEVKNNSPKEKDSEIKEKENSKNNNKESEAKKYKDYLKEKEEEYINKEKDKKNKEAKNNTEENKDLNKKLEDSLENSKEDTSLKDTKVHEDKNKKENDEKQKENKENLNKSFEEKDINKFKDYHNEKCKFNDDLDPKAKIEECDKFLSKVSLEREEDPYENERYEMGKKFSDYEKQIEEMKSNKNSDDIYEVDFDCPIGELLKGALYECPRVLDFAKDIKRCSWYKVSINSFDEMCNMANYNKYTMLYYPMINYYPYIIKEGHFFFGVKCDKDHNIKYILYAIPGGKDRLEQPYGGRTGFVTWDEYGDEAKGYWIMFYDFENSTVVIPMK